MDVLEFCIRKTGPDNLNGIVAVPFINGKSLVDIIKEAELKYDKSLAGSYDGIRPDLLFNELKDGSIHDINKSRILECECGVDGCWSLLMSVKESDKFISWSDFEQIHRTNWSLSEVGPFKFDKLDYRKKVEALSVSFLNNL
jgi:hypothetical protein